VEFEWDETKRQTNIAKHGVDFTDAALVFEGAVLETEERRWDYGERRYRALGLFNGRVLYVIYTWRQDRRRIISARRASRDERETYYAGVRRQIEEDEE
jgi:uncharacterized DUF497 family protein